MVAGGCAFDGGSAGILGGSGLASRDAVEIEGASASRGTLTHTSPAAVAIGCT